jgi:transposase
MPVQNRQRDRLDHLILLIPCWEGQCADPGEKQGPAKDAKMPDGEDSSRRLTSTRRIEKKSGPEKAPAEQLVKDIRRATRRQFSAEEKIRIVLEGVRGEESIAELCRREGIASSMYYGWSKEFLDAGKRRLAGDTARAATSDEVKELRREAQALKEAVADLTLENRLLKKSMLADGEDET